MIHDKFELHQMISDWFWPVKLRKASVCKVSDIDNENTLMRFFTMFTQSGIITNKLPKISWFKLKDSKYHGWFWISMWVNRVIGMKSNHISGKLMFIRNEAKITWMWKRELLIKVLMFWTWSFCLYLLFALWYVFLNVLSAK